LAGKDRVNHPEHYGADTTYEHVKVMEAWGLLTDALLYNCTKYICRLGKKGVRIEDQLEDLRKAKWYLEKKIEVLDRTTRVDTELTVDKENFMRP
jgi:hypothetical protein